MTDRNYAGMRRKRGFVLPKLDPFVMRQKGIVNGRISEAFLGARSAEQRILMNTPRLKALYDFLRESRLRVP